MKCFKMGLNAIQIRVRARERVWGATSCSVKRRENFRGSKAASGTYFVGPSTVTPTTDKAGVALWVHQ